MYKIYEKLRDERGLNDYQVAKKTGISTVTLSHWKSGLYTPKIDKVQKIAELFDVPIETFYKESSHVPV